MSISGKSILVIDDDAPMLRALNKVLTGEGALVTTACWAGEAIEHLTDKSGRFDLIITDLQMPILGGRTILGAVMVALPQVPVIIVTAFGNADLKAECLRSGAAAFLEKPLDAAQLVEAVERALSARRSTPSPRAPRRRGVKRGNVSSSDAPTDSSSRTEGPVRASSPHER